MAFVDIESVFMVDHYGQKILSSGESSTWPSVQIVVAVTQVHSWGLCTRSFQYFAVMELVIGVIMTEVNVEALVKASSRSFPTFYQRAFISDF